MMKKIAAAILSAVLAVSALPVNRSSAASDYQFSYVVVEGGIKITEGVGSGEKLEIPSEYEGCTVSDENSDLDPELLHLCCDR